MNKVKALVVCARKAQLLDNQDNTSLDFTGTQGKSGKESEEIHDATPVLRISMSITQGKPAADYFEQGEEYYIYFEKKPKDQ
jgi:hypothetical protein